MRDGLIHMRQQKTGRALAIPITDGLAAAIAAVPSEHLVFLLSETGRPFTAEGFGRWFRQQCRRIGLTGSPPGLRKASCRRMAEAGCSAHEIASISGHATLREVQRYCEAADQGKMARNAMARIRTATSTV